MPALPIALARDTIFECAFETRFINSHPSIAELLPGIVFSKLQGRFTNHVTLPLAQMPKPMRLANPQLKYSPTAALEGPQVRMMFSEHSVVVAFVRPYAGWVKVKPLILECMNAAIETKLTGQPERYGLKYVNLLQDGRDEFDLDQTRIRIALGEFQLRPRGPTTMRTETEVNGCTNIIEVATGAKVAIPGVVAEQTGVVIAVDTARDASSFDAGSDLAHVLETLHHTEKTVFFGLLQDPTIERLGPRYPVTH